jgi:hypothetical protein
VSSLRDSHYLESITGDFPTPTHENRVRWGPRAVPGYRLYRRSATLLPHNLHHPLHNLRFSKFVSLRLHRSPKLFTQKRRDSPNHGGHEERGAAALDSLLHTQTMFLVEVHHSL